MLVRSPRAGGGVAGWWGRTTPIGRIAVAIAGGMAAITLVALLLSPWLRPLWQAYLGMRQVTDLDGALALQRAVETALLIWLAAVLAAGVTVLVDWWLDRPRR
jgi:hypothetical protein